MKYTGIITQNCEFSGAGVKINFRMFLILLITNYLLFSCVTFRHKSPKIYLSFPVNVNRLVENYKQKADKNNTEIYIELTRCITDSCNGLYKLLIYEDYPKKDERSQYDQFITTNTFFHTKDTDIPIILGSDIYTHFRYYLKYPVHDNFRLSEYPFQIYFTEDSLVNFGYNWNLIHCK